MLINGKPILGRVIFAHGAGAGMHSAFMEKMALKLAEIGLEVVRFDFPYMQKISLEGKRRPPDRMPTLLAFFQQVIEEYSDDLPLYLAGKSMGGRVASMLMADSKVSACFVFGYPFHPQGKPDKLRTEHLAEIDKPLHIFQGTRDKMGSLSEVTEYNLTSSVVLHWMSDGDHDLKPRKSSGFTQEDHQNQIVSIIEGCVN